MVEMKLAKVIVTAILLSILIYHLPTILLVEKETAVRMLKEEPGEDISVTLQENQTVLSENTINKTCLTTKTEDVEDQVDRLRENLSIHFIESVFISLLTALTISAIVKKSYLEKE